MNLNTTMSAQHAPAETGSPRMIQIAQRQRLQDALFHRVTQAFSLLVLLALLGIIVSLLVNAWPTFHKIWRAVHLVRGMGHHQSPTAHREAETAKAHRG